VSVADPPLVRPDGFLDRQTRALWGDEDLILGEARTRFTHCSSWERMAQQRWRDDYQFGNADADNMYQWPATIYSARNGAERPCLTINKTRQHCLQVINDARQNKAAIRITATGGGATAQSATIYEGIVRHIEYISNAPQAYDAATYHQVFAGIGYWRVMTDYVDDDSLDQDIFIRRVNDPLGVFLDPDIKEYDGSDARFGFIFADQPRDKVESEYPIFRNKPITRSTSIDGEEPAWIRDDHVRVAEYFRLVETPDWLFVDTQGKHIKGSDVPSAEARQALREHPDVRKRRISRKQLQWFKIVGDEIVDRRDLPGKYIPIVRVVGEETVIDHQLDRKGHVRALKDPQRIYNYNRSAEVEYGALQTKAPWITPAAAIEGREPAWNNANRENRAYLTWNHRDEEGQEIPPPTRPDPPQGAPVFAQGAQMAAEDMMLVSGQYQAMMGAQGNERSGVAIERRQREGDNATYHYIDHLASAIRYTGRIILDWVPEVYTTERVVRILAEDGSESPVTVSPNGPQAVTQVARQGQIARIFNPNVGRYEVQADVGKGWGTQRQEASEAILQIITQAPNMMPVVGDLLFRNLDFPGAEEIAERLKNMVPPQALGGASPEMQQAQQTIQQLQQQLQKMDAAQRKTLDALSTEKIKGRDTAAQKEIDIFDANTKRISALKEMLPIDEGGLRAMIRQLVVETLQSTLTPAAAALAPTLTRAAMATPQTGMPQPQMQPQPQQNGGPPGGGGNGAGAPPGFGP
jgi:hypothetical protein